MNVFTTFITIVGNDINGKQIKNKLKGIKNCKIILLNEAKKISTTKTRYFVNGQQLIRVDEEDKLELSKKNYVGFTPKCVLNTPGLPHKSGV